jgi:hypothetical protein
MYLKKKDGRWFIGEEDPYDGRSFTAAIADTAPLAICLAALKAVKLDVTRE